MTRPPVALAVFDIAGTTVRDDGDAVGRCLRAALAAAGLDVSREAANAVMGLPKPEAIRRLVERAGGAAGAAELARLHDDFRARMLRHYAEDPGVGEIPGARAAFALLRAAGVRVALDTGFDRELAAAVLRRLGWSVPATLDAWIASDEVARGRPYPDMIHALMARLGVADPARVAKVGDTPADLAEGTSAGCGWVIGVLSGSHAREALAAVPHTHLVASVADVPSLLGVGAQRGYPAAHEEER